MLAEVVCLRYVLLSTTHSSCPSLIPLAPRTVSHPTGLIQRHQAPLTLDYCAANPLPPVHRSFILSAARSSCPALCYLDVVVALRSYTLDYC